MKKVIIENLKKIKKLEFELPTQGVWLLTGLNGSGKTSLLASLYRIGESSAFPRYYKTSSLNSKLDLFDTTAITYIVNGISVTYKYGGQRWRGKPNLNTNIFQNFNYPSVVFIGADGSRIEPFQDEIETRNIRVANPLVIDILTYVLDDQKWNNLKFVNTRRGGGRDNEAYIISYLQGRNTHYYSEKNFSLGELSIFKLAKVLSSIGNDSLVLIDEIEMALHPQAQIRLLEKLKQISTERNLTVIFSTHSTTLIKTHDRNNIIFLQETEFESREYICKLNLYPAQILGEIAYDDELGLDFLFFVEDDQAKLLLHQIIEFYFKLPENTNKVFPMFKIIPVGGFKEVVRMLDNSSQIFPNHIKRVAFLDHDVLTNSVPNMRKPFYINLFAQHNASIKYLPCTPELGVTHMIESNVSNNNMQQMLSQHLLGHTFHINRVVASRTYNEIIYVNPRDQAKKRVEYISDSLKNITGQQIESIHRIFYKVYCEDLYSSNFGQIRGLLNPIFS